MSYPGVVQIELVVVSQSGFIRTSENISWRKATFVTFDVGEVYFVAAIVSISYNCCETKPLKVKILVGY